MIPYRITKLVLIFWVFLEGLRFENDSREDEIVSKGFEAQKTLETSIIPFEQFFNL